MVTLLSLLVVLGAEDPWSEVDGQALPPYPSSGFEVQLAPYTPLIGSPKEQKHFKLYFGSSQHFLKLLQLNRYFDTWYGLAGVLMQVGYFKVEGKTRICKAGESIIPCTSETLPTSLPGNDTTSLTAIPISLGLLYRLTYLADAWRIPLFPYVRGGLDYFFWEAKGGSKVAHTPDKQAGDGGTAGYHGSAGLAVDLDWLDSGTLGPKRKRAFYSGALFVEYTERFANHFGNTKRLNFSDGYLAFGLSLDLL